MARTPSQSASTSSAIITESRASLREDTTDRGNTAKATPAQTPASTP